MTENLAHLLLRRSEAGEPALLWGREAKPFYGPAFDRLIARGVLVACAPAREWRVCDDCRCGQDWRPIEQINGQLLAICPLDRRSDLALEPEDLESYEIDAAALVREMTSNSGLMDEPACLMPGLWMLAALSGGPVLCIALSRMATEQPGLIHSLKAVTRSGAISLLTPAMTKVRAADFQNAGIDVLATIDALADSNGETSLALNLAKVVPATTVASALILVRPRLTATLRGFEIQLPPRAFELFWLLAETVAHGGGIVTRRQIEQRLWGSQNVAKTAAADAIRDLREQLAALPKDTTSAELIETRHGKGYLLVLTADAVQLVS